MRPAEAGPCRDSLSPRGRGRGPREAREGEGAGSSKRARTPSPSHRCAMGPSLSREGRGKSGASSQAGEAGLGGGVENGVGVDAVGAVKVGEVARLAEMVD